MGHRNPQGLYFDKENNFLLEAEHGPEGGDEINLIKFNQNTIPNYGWGISSYGEHYGGKKAPQNKKKYLKLVFFKVNVAVYYYYFFLKFITHCTSTSAGDNSRFVDLRN